jgi:hypothetical protein
MRVLQICLHLVSIAGENEGDHSRSALEKEATIETGTAFKEVFPESMNVRASVEMRTAESLGRR